MGCQYEQNCVGKADDSLACLRAVDIKTTQRSNVNKPFSGGSTTPAPSWCFLPVVDRDLVQDCLYSLFDQNKFIHVPLVVSVIIMRAPTLHIMQPASLRWLSQRRSTIPVSLINNLGEIIKKAYLHVEPLPNHSAYFASAAAAYGGSTFTCPGHPMAATMAEVFGSRQVWNY
jgi:acetylcholinesterase